MIDVTLKSAVELIESKNSGLVKNIIRELSAFYEDTSKIVMYDNNTELPDLNIRNDIVIVNGNLKISGDVEDCYGVDYSLLIVLGDLICSSLITLSDVYILGDLIARNVILGDSLCDCALSVDGDINANTLLEYGHFITSNKNILVNNIFSAFDLVKDKNGSVSANLTTEDLIDEVVGTFNGAPSKNLPKTIQYIKRGGVNFKK